MNHDSKSKPVESKEPWLAVAVSLLLPGLGHVYIHQTAKGICLLVTTISLQLLALWSLLSADYEPYVSLLLTGTALPLIAIACIDSYRKTRSPRADRPAKAKHSPKNPWLAVFLSLIIPGTGHLYLRRYWLFAAYLLACLLLGTIVKARIDEVRITSLLRAAFGSLAVAHAYYLAIRAKGQNPPANDKRWLIAVLLSPPCMQMVTIVVVTFVMQASSIGRDGGCMEPTLTIRDRVLVNKMSYVHASPQPGDIIAFTIPEAYRDRAGRTATKRVAAIAGETIQKVRGKFVVIDMEGNSRTLTPPARLLSAQYWPSNRNTPQPPGTFGVTEPYTVPPNNYFLLGDNLDNSYDSRYVGPIPRDLIIGKVTKIYWPPNRACVLDR